MTEITPELQALAYALADVLAEHDRNTCIHENIKRGGAIWTICEDCDRKWADDQGGFKPYADPPKIAEAREQLSAYRATQAPKECRPPDGAKNCSWWWLIGPMGVPFVAFWRAGAWAGDIVSTGPDVSVQLATKRGWTCHSECRFGETGVEATDALIGLWVANSWPSGNYTQDKLRTVVREAITHFRAPKLEISDEEIDAIAYAAWVAPGSPSGIKEALRSVARAVIATVGGEK